MTPGVLKKIKIKKAQSSACGFPVSLLSVSVSASLFSLAFPATPGCKGRREGGEWCHTAGMKKGWLF